MSMTELQLSFPTEKLDALRFFMDKKQQSIEHELQDYLDKTYEKLVPAQVREYVESRMEPVSAQRPDQRQESPVSARERPLRQPRRSRQAASEAAPAPEAPPESEGPDEQENQGMTLGM
ncbi:DUF6103 family protein [Caproicibacter fermentans]|jgi:hypothetical protein|uniref:Uncharacterized protein n=1 Tax=Caproicibacter fermentans TaxID=2576756 RepID=A0A7G8T8Q8_9FIRM|nr:DUF6103 family protein [Caproicibacter fermentans]QNK39999.1 hypothetical protein HCR03_14995 [Caproicibacter fermentans]